MPVPSTKNINDLYCRICLLFPNNDFIHCPNKMHMPQKNNDLFNNEMRLKLVQLAKKQHDHDNLSYLQLEKLDRIVKDTVFYFQQSLYLSTPNLTQFIYHMDFIFSIYLFYQWNPLLLVRNRTLLINKSQTIISFIINYCIINELSDNIYRAFMQFIINGMLFFCFFLFLWFFFVWFFFFKY